IPVANVCAGWPAFLVLVFRKSSTRSAAYLRHETVACQVTLDVSRRQCSGLILSLSFVAASNGVAYEDEKFDAATISLHDATCRAGFIFRNTSKVTGFTDFSRSDAITSEDIPCSSLRRRLISSSLTLH